MNNVNGLHIVFLPANQAYALMWYDHILGIGTRQEMKARMQELLRR